MTSLLERAMPHLVIAPILLPMLTAAVTLLLGEGRLRLKAALGFACTLAGLATSLALLASATTRGPVTYVPGGWPTAVGIAVVLDRLAALLLVLAWTLGACVLVFGAARSQRAGVHFHPLLLLELMGLSGAFLAGDLFNLFVFFEILLAASYGLLLHGAGRSRIVSGLRYVAANLLSSSLFLVGAAMLYGVTGTLNLASLADHLALVSAQDQGLLHAGAAILAVAFLVKAAGWPLNFWLVPAYSAATAPAAALFAILTEVGVYALLRTAPLFSLGVSLGGDALLTFGTVTAALAAMGMLGTQRPGRQAGLSVIVSAGTLLAALGLGRPSVTGAGLYYLASSVLSGSALFLVVDLVERWRGAGAPPEEPAPFLTPALVERDVNLDDEERPLIGIPFPRSAAFLGYAFLACTLLVTGMPPLSSFVGKVLMLSGALSGLERGDDGPVRVWLFLALLLGTGFLSLVALTRTGIRTFWSPSRRPPPRIRLAEGLPIAALLGASLALTVCAGPVSQYTHEIARGLQQGPPHRAAGADPHGVEGSEAR